MVVLDKDKGIVKLYVDMQMPISKIEEVYGICRPYIKSVLDKNDIKISPLNTCRKYGYENKKKQFTFNEHFFDEIDTEEKAYIFGFFLADGSNVIKQRSVCMSLQSEDKYILERISNILDSDRPIRHINPPKRFPHRKHQDMIILRSMYFSKKLESLGMCRMKSYLLKFPSFIPDNLMNHFVRGYFDGDGSIYYSKNGNGYRYGFNFVGTEDFIIGLRATLMKSCEFSEVKIDTRFPERHNSTRYITYNGRLQAIKFGEWIYKDATIYLKRKLDKFPPEVKHLTGLTTQ